MIYECPNCHTPQTAGRTSCHQCGAEFDGPVPADATVAESVTAAPPVAPPADAMPQPSPVQVAPPPLENISAPEPPAYLPPPAYPPPPAYQQTVYAQNAPPASKFPVPKVLLIAIPIVLVLVLGAIFFASTLNQGSDTASTTTPAESPAPAVTPTPAPAPQGSPLVLSGGSGSGGTAGTAGSMANNPATAWLAGRWQDKDTDFYVFNDNGTGYRGSISGKQSKGSFLWVLVQKQLILYADAASPEKLSFSQGSDDATMYLRGPDGRYMQYTRSKGAG